MTTMTTSDIVLHSDDQLQGAKNPFYKALQQKQKSDTKTACSKPWYTSIRLIDNHHHQEKLSYSIQNPSLPTKTKNSHTSISTDQGMLTNGNNGHSTEYPQSGNTKCQRWAATQNGNTKRKYKLQRNGSPPAAFTAVLPAVKPAAATTKPEAQNRKHLLSMYSNRNKLYMFWWAKQKGIKQLTWTILFLLGRYSQRQYYKINNWRKNQLKDPLIHRRTRSHFNQDIQSLPYHTLPLHNHNLSTLFRFGGNRRRYCNWSSINPIAFEANATVAA